MKSSKRNEGFVLTGALMLLLIGIMVAGSFLFISQQSRPAVVRWVRHDQALLAAQTAVERVKANLYNNFQVYHMQSNTWSDLTWVVANASSQSISNTLLGTVLGTNRFYAYQVPCAYSNAIITATVRSGQIVTNVLDERSVMVTNTVSATMNGVTRTIEETVCYVLHRSKVFDNSYFINNFGWFYSVNCVVNGDIRSNEDNDLRSSSLVLNGYAYAVGMNDVNTPYTTWTWNTYTADANSPFFRPNFYVDPTRTNSGTLFNFGFKGSSVTSNGASRVEVPPIGNLADYIDLAQQKNGTIQTGTVVVVNNYFNGTGPSGVTNAPDKGSLVLVGTAAKPIVLNGPVVVAGDVLIKGYYTGQGTIYAGRNIHIIGDLTAVNTSQWPKPDTATNFNNVTVPANLQKDFLGLCARGAIVMGNYNSSDFQTGLLSQHYLEPSFVGTNTVSPMDADLGYVSFVSNGVSYFNGDYTANDGGKQCGDTVATNGVPRSYYQSSLSDTKFNSLFPSGSNWVSRIDAVIYNNHLTTGLLKDATINGSIVCRDEAMLLSGRAYFNWDARLGVESFRPYLPPTMEPADTIQWREL